MSIMVTNKIKQARKAAGLTQKEMSQMMGIPLDTIKGWDSGRTAGPPEWVERLVVKELERISEIKTEQI